MAFSSNSALCPEKRMLLCCARSRMRPSDIQLIRELAALPLDWDYLFSQAGENSVVPLLYRHLSREVADVVAPAPMARLKGLACSSAMHSLLLTAEMVRISRIFQGEGVQVIPYKGPVLAAQIYGDIAMRDYEDLDIILRQEDMPKAHSLLMALGFQPRFPWDFSTTAAASRVPGEYSYSDLQRSLLIELHTERTLRHLPVPLPIGEMGQRLHAVELSGHLIQAFSPEDTLVLLCVHGTKDFWARISWITDVAEFIASQTSLKWREVFQLTDRLRARRMLHLGLILADRVLGASLPKEILIRIREDPTAARVASEIEGRLLAGDGCRPTLFGNLLYRRRMVRGTLAGWRYALCLATAPAEEDWRMARLPRPLAPLYAALRPLRLLRKYGVISRRSTRPSS